MMERCQRREDETKAFAIKLQHIKDELKDKITLLKLQEEAHHTVP
jgi:hypothetical protein